MQSISQAQAAQHGYLTAALVWLTSMLVTGMRARRCQVASQQQQHRQGISCICSRLITAVSQMQRQGIMLQKTTQSACLSRLRSCTSLAHSAGGSRPVQLQL